MKFKWLLGWHTFHAKVDTGADGNILLARCLEKMPSVNLQDDQTRITAYNGTEIKQLGVLEVECTFNVEKRLHRNSMW